MNKLSPSAGASAHSSPQVRYRKAVLSNGLRIVTEELPHVRSVAIGVWIDVGSRDEDEENNGISHFIEHMVFKGTKHYSLQQIARSLESVGGYLNAFTSKEHTCFYARALDDHLPRAVSVIADLVCFAQFDRQEVEKEKSVVLEELKNIEDDPDDLIHDCFDQNIYSRHPLGFPVIGREDNIKRFTREDLFKYMGAYYQPHRMVVAAVGNLQHENVVRLVEQKFSRPAVRSKLRKRLRGPRSHRPRTQVVEKPITQAHICLGTIAGSLRSAQRYPLLLMNTLLGEGMSSRLFQSLRERHGLAYNVYSFVSTMSDTGNFGVYVGTDPAHIDHAIDLIRKEFEKLKSAPVHAAELKRTASQVKGTLMLSLESLSSRLMRLGAGEMYYGENISPDEIIRRIDGVTSEEIHESAGAILHLENFSTVIFRPHKHREGSIASHRVSRSIH